MPATCEAEAQPSQEGTNVNNVGIAAVPRLGSYRGQCKDFTCPGDNVTWEILLLGGDQCALECIPELSYFKGGQPPWRCEGTWTWDADDMEICVSITKQDAIGPRKDSDVKIPVSQDGTLTFKESKCVWQETPPSPAADKLAKMSLKELKAALIGMGIDPSGCIERADFEARLLRSGSSAEAPQAEASEAPAAEDAARATLESMTIAALVKKAIEIGATSEEIDDTVDSDKLRYMLIQFILAKQEKAEAVNIVPADTVQWMWGDAGMGALGHFLAQKDPLRWSDWNQLGATISDLDTFKDAKRPVEIRSKRTMAIVYFDSVDKVLLALREQPGH